ncbi:MAG TPA: adenylate/guanylate cyclase domain-containing protein [Blastocatellia bacterium]|nr:adenylate/guanylate cyclase domain-containing protein [Blastocatellia bacterium]
MPKLLVKNPETGRAVEYDLDREVTRIGRAVDRNEVVLHDGQVSREHAIVKRTGDGFLLVDLDSANGTFVGGQRIKEHPLKNRDSFTISKYTIELRDHTAQLSIRYENKQIGGTVFMRTPGQIASIVPGIERVSIAPGDPESQQQVVDYVSVLKKKAETLERLYELNRILSSDFSQEKILKKVSEMVFRLTAADRFFVLLRDDQSDELWTEAAEFRSPNAHKETEEIFISKTVVDRVMNERVSLLSIDAQTDDRFADAQSIIMHNIRSVMCSPLVGNDRVLGVIYSDCTERAKILREDDLDLLNAVAAEASIAVDNARTHDRLVREELARAKYRRFMPPHVVDEILANPETLALGGTNSLVTVLFSDVRGFTSMSETMAPQAVVRVLNEYFAEMTPIVFGNRGLLDKYMGDGLMALFGVPYDDVDSAISAVTCAIEMQWRMSTVNEGLKGAGLPEIAIGIGINTGTATVGYIGSEERTDYTAIGDAVNLGARLEKRAEADQIIISRATLEAIGDRFPVKPCYEIMVKGKRDAVQIYEVLWREVKGSSEF